MQLFKRIDLLVLWAGRNNRVTLGIRLLSKQDWVLLYTHDS